jgi:uncharacterized protein involved in exopolysaccharide biosynthesis
MFHSDNFANSGNRDPIFTGVDTDVDVLPALRSEQQTVSTTHKPGLKSLVLIAGLTALAGLSPWLIPNPAPATFTTAARVALGSKADATPETRALIQDHIGILTSQASLDRVVRDLDLAADANFDTRKQGGMDLLLDLVLGKEGSFAESEAARRALLDKAVHVTATPARDQVTIAVTLTDARQSARIANHMARLLVADMAESAVAGTDADLDKRRGAIASAQAALAAFIATENPTALADARRLTGDIGATDNQLDLAQARLITLEQRAADAKLLTLADITDKVTGVVSDTPMLADLHQKFVAATMSVDQLSAALGPRHPRLLAAQSAVAQVRKDIQTALGRLGAAIQEQIKANGKDIEAFNVKRATLVATQQQTGVDVARLQSLETAVDTARQNYLDHVQRRETVAPRTHSIAASILSSAAPATAIVSGVSRSALSASAALAGLGLGLCIVMIRLALRPNAPAPVVEALMTEAPIVEASAIEAPAVDAEITPDLSLFAPGFLSEFVFEPIETPSEILNESRPVLELQTLPHREMRYRTPANNGSLADHIRDVLIDGGYPVDDAHLLPHDEDIRDLRLEMAALRERVAVYTTRRSSARG